MTSYLSNDVIVIIIVASFVKMLFTLCASKSNFFGKTHTFVVLLFPGSHLSEKVDCTVGSLKRTLALLNPPKLQATVFLAELHNKSKDSQSCKSEVSYHEKI